MMNTITVLVTLLVTALAAIIFIASYTKIFGHEDYAAELKRAFEVRTGFGEIKQKLLFSDFENAFDSNYQNDLTTEVKALGADAIIISNEEVLFSTREFSKLDIEKCLAFSNTRSSFETMVLEGKTYIFDRSELRKLRNKDNVVLILLAPVILKTHFYQALLFSVIAGFVITFLGMNLWVSRIFSKGIISPLSRLTTVATKISTGDLDCEIVEEGEGEVRALCKTLEQMRIKLKEAVYLQKKYDENRKFLVSSISHDLKTPVTSIKCYIEGILDGVAKTPEKVENYLEIARTKAILVNTMIDDLTLYSRLDSNQIPFNFEKTDLVQYFEYSVADNLQEFTKANITLSLQNELKDAICVFIDKERFRRVVQNILDNAKKYITRRDGKVDIILRETRTSVVIEIRDNGKGISDEEVTTIFERFYRSDASRKSAEGSGLGLAIAMQIVEEHEGKIWAKSFGEEGTSILISLRKY